MQVAIHAGAAFTDEGRLLTSLQANNQILRENGIEYFGPRRYRRSFKPAFDRVNSGSSLNVVADQIRGILPQDENTHRAVFLSNEFSGERGSALLDGQLYPQAGSRIALLTQAFQDHEVEVFFALRNPGTLIPKLLLSLPEPDRESIIKNTDISCLSWIGMVEDIRDLAPDVPLTLWSNEDTPFIWGEVIRSIAALPESTPLNGEFDLLLSLLSDVGKKKAEEVATVDQALSEAELRDALAKILEEHAQPEKVEEELDLPGWSSEVIEAFSELYEQDLARLETTPGVRLLRP